MDTLAYVDEPQVTDEEREVCPHGTKFRRAKFPAVESNALTVIIGTPDREAADDPTKRAVHAHWAEVKRAYEQERKAQKSKPAEEQDPVARVEIKVEEALDPVDDGQEAQEDLSEVVGTRQANALNDAGYGTLEAARALSKEDLTEIDGVGEATYEKLQEA